MFYKPYKKYLGRSYIMYSEKQLSLLEDFFWYVFCMVIFGSD